MSTLTPREQGFVTEFLVDRNATQAAIRAGYSKKTAASQASRLLRKAKIREAVNAGVTQAANLALVTVADVLVGLGEIALVDPGDAFDDKGRLLPLKQMPRAVRRAIASFKAESKGLAPDVDGDGEVQFSPAQLAEVKFWNKNEALRDIGRHLKMFVDKVEVDPSTSWAKLVQAISDVEKKNAAESAAAAPAAAPEAASTAPAEVAPSLQDDD